MNYYQEISLLHKANIELCCFWEKLYQQIHLALVENKRTENQSAIGVAFPEYDSSEYSLGTKLRLFAADKQSLKQMQCDKWLERLKDYIHLSEIKSVPEKVEGYACFKHIRPNGSKENLARRRAKRKGETFEQALVHFETYEANRSQLPYINMHSETNGQRFQLFIEKTIVDQPQAGFYSCYGLSSKTTVPVF